MQNASKAKNKSKLMLKCSYIYGIFTKFFCVFLLRYKLNQVTTLQTCRFYQIQSEHGHNKVQDTSFLLQQKMKVSYKKNVTNDRKRRCHGNCGKYV